MVYVGVVASRLRDRDGGGRGGRSAASSPAARRRPPRSTSAPPRTGYDWAEENLPDRPAVPRRADGRRPPDKILIEGNKAAALGALFGGASVLTWYPITPSSSLAEYAEEFLKKHRVEPDGKRTFAVVQAEDELAADRHGRSAPAGPGPAR